MADQKVITKKYAMKNEKTNMYWTNSCFPPVTENPWKAELFDSPEEARQSIGYFLGQSQNPQDFKSVELNIVETKLN